MIYVASDHNGYNMKEDLIEYMISRGYKVKDLGTDKKDERVDYPEFAQRIAQKVASEVNARGILISDTGQGMCVAANKTKGINAVVVFNEDLAEKTRLEENSNVLCLPANYIAEELAKRIVGTWLSTSFSGVEYYVKCLKQIREMEKNG